MLQDNPENIIWWALSSNPAAINLIEAKLREDPGQIMWEELSRNPAAIHLLESNPDKIDWFSLSSNPAAIHLLQANPENIDSTMQHAGKPYGDCNVDAGVIGQSPMANTRGDERRDQRSV